MRALAVCCPLPAGGTHAAGCCSYAMLVTEHKAWQGGFPRWEGLETETRPVQRDWYGTIPMFSIGKSRGLGPLALALLRGTP